MNKNYFWLNKSWKVLKVKGLLLIIKAVKNYNHLNNNKIKIKIKKLKV